MKWILPKIALGLVLIVALSFLVSSPAAAQSVAINPHSTQPLGPLNNPFPIQSSDPYAHIL